MVVLCTAPVISGFISPSYCDTCPTTTMTTTTRGTLSEHNAISHRTTTSALSMEFPKNPFSSFFDFIPFGDDGQNSDNKDDKAKDVKEGGTMKYKGGEDGVIDSNEEEIAATEIFHLPAKKIKAGGLRLYLALYFMGECNTPNRKTWRADQTPEGGIDLYFHDRTGALIIALNDSGMSVSRLGSAPSMEYVMQESVMLRGMLDQLDDITG